LIGRNSRVVSGVNPFFVKTADSPTGSKGTKLADAPTLRTQRDAPYGLLDRMTSWDRVKDFGSLMRGGPQKPPSGMKFSESTLLFLDKKRKVLKVRKRPWPVAQWRCV